MKNLLQTKLSKNIIFLKLLTISFLIIEIIFLFFIKTFNKFITDVGKKINKKP